MAESNLYETLGISRDAAPEQVRKAYKKRALQTHPDRQPPGMSAAEKAAAEEKFRKVNHAYEVLNDAENRRIYDLHGVWPPPDAREQSRARPSSHQPDAWHSFSNNQFDPFFDFPDPFGGNRRHFGYTDPFELFNSMFGDIHRRHGGSGSPFGDPFFEGFPSPFGSAPRSSRPVELPSFGSLFGGGMPPFPGMNGRNTNVRSASYSSMGYDDGRGEPRWVSQSNMTRTINGVTESILKRTDTNGNEHVTLTYPDGRQRHTVNGIEQPSSSSRNDRHIQGPPPPAQNERYLPPPSQNAQTAFVPPNSVRSSYQPDYKQPVRPQPEYTYEPEHHSTRRSSYPYSEPVIPGQSSHRYGSPLEPRSSRHSIPVHEPVRPDYQTPPPSYAPPQGPYNSGGVHPDYREAVRDHQDGDSSHGKRHWWKWWPHVGSHLSKMFKKRHDSAKEHFTRI